MACRQLCLQQVRAVQDVPFRGHENEDVADRVPVGEQDGLPRGLLDIGFLLAVLVLGDRLIGNGDRVGPAGDRDHRGAAEVAC